MIIIINETNMFFKYSLFFINCNFFNSNKSISFLIINEPKIKKITNLIITSKLKNLNEKKYKSSYFAFSTISIDNKTEQAKQKILSFKNDMFFFFIQ